MLMKIGLGTVQFGLPYGLTNQDGMTSKEEVAQILHRAANSKVRVLDTAPAYGASEEVLGELLNSNHKFHIVTKTLPIKQGRISDEHVYKLQNTFDRSLSQLKQSSVYGLLVHHADDLLVERSEYIVRWMEQMKSEGLVHKIGVSIYNQQQYEEVVRRHGHFIDLIQLPMNVLDQRLIQSGVLRLMKEKNIEIHARSAFLQGLLVTTPQSLPPYFDSVKKHLLRYREHIQNRNVTAVQAALAFVTGISQVDAVICGVNNDQQWKEILDVPNVQNMDWSSFAFDESRIINPSEWQVTN